LFELAKKILLHQSVTFNLYVKKPLSEFLTKGCFFVGFMLIKRA